MHVRLTAEHRDILISKVILWTWFRLAKVRSANNQAGADAAGDVEKTPTAPKPPHLLNRLPKAITQKELWVDPTRIHSPVNDGMSLPFSSRIRG